jgi:drug/metabolite transporter (DMT)-like permease
VELLAIVLSLGAALFVALGFVVQQHAAAEEPPEARMSFRLLFDLMHRPLWLLGIGAMVCGQVLGAMALGRGDLALVEPIMAANLLFALPLAALWRRRQLSAREIGGAVALIVGLTMFLAAGDPYGGTTSRLAWPNWIVSAGSVALAAALFVSVGRRLGTRTEATFLGAAAGTLYGLQDALTQRVMAELGQGVPAMLTTWTPFTLVVVAVLGMLCAQSAFEEAPLSASLPAMTVAEPVTGIAFGVGVYGEHLDLGAAMLAIEVIGFAAMVVGVYLVAGGSFLGASAPPLGSCRPCSPTAPEGSPMALDAVRAEAGARVEPER